ncbi:hypothetical protein LINPERPRIM_LOCUS36908 [Linum perenne]
MMWTILLTWATTWIMAFSVFPFRILIFVIGLGTASWGCPH